MNHDSTVFVGLDVHKESITVAYAIDMGDVELLGKIGTLKADIDRLCKRVQSKAHHIRVVYEAGPCGYGLYRDLVERGFDCVVCAHCALVICQRYTYRMLKTRRSGTWLAHGQQPRQILDRPTSG